MGICPYDAYPLIKISQNYETNWWQTPDLVHGSGQFAIAGDQAFFLRKGLIAQLALGADHKAELIGEFPVADWPEKITALACRGDQIYLLADLGLYQLILPVS